MASTASQRRGLQGIGKLRRILRELPVEAVAPVRAAIEKGATYILADQQTMVPKDTGDTAAALDMKIGRDGLSAKIGLITKQDQREGYVARFIEFGTKGSAAHNIPPQPARPFMGPSLDLNVEMVKDDVAAGLAAALRKVNSGPADE